MAAERRGAEEVKRELTAEREQLVGALADLRKGVHDARRIPIIAGGALATGLAAFAAIKFVRGRGD
jgi:NAD(P)H-dependent flavin oxidoreductase YrpB (nitropropane dioxygenase family)